MFDRTVPEEVAAPLPKEVTSVCAVVLKHDAECASTGPVLPRPFGFSMSGSTLIVVAKCALLKRVKRRVRGGVTEARHGNQNYEREK
jgi:hypothetical protein